MKKRVDFRKHSCIDFCDRGNSNQEEVITMAAEPRVARVTEIIAGSPKGFEDAVKIGFSRASKTLRGITGLRVVESRVHVENSKIVEFRVRMEVIFVLET
jgi:flavin-binding protein dodecin